MKTVAALVQANLASFCTNLPSDYKVRVILIITCPVFTEFLTILRTEARGNSKSEYKRDFIWRFNLQGDG